MPSRNRNREAKKAVSPGASSASAAAPKSKAKSKKKRRTAKPAVDPSDVPDAEIRFIQPYEATKPYICPGCGRDIPPGQGHMVAVPPSSPDLRRHWHRGCWENRHNRR